MTQSTASLTRDVFAYGGVQAASRLAPIVGIFVYAWVMPLDDYGVLTLYFATIWLAGLVVSANMHAGIGRLLFVPEIDRRAFLGTVGITLACWFAISAIGWIVLRHTTATLFNLPSQIIVLQTVVGAGLIAESAVTQIMVYQRRSATLLRVVGLRSIAAFGLGLTLVMLRSDSLYLGVVYAEAIVSALFIAVVLHLVAPSATLTFRPDYLRRLAAYSMPLIAYAASTTLLAQSDRILIGNYIGVEAAGIYGLVYNLAAIALLGTIPLLNAFQPRFFDALNNSQPAAMKRDAELLIVPALIVTAGLVLWGPSIGRAIFSDSFDDGFSMLPVLALGSLAQVGATIWNRVMSFENRTGLVSLTVAIPLAANLAANALLLPRHGYKVAAITTLGSQLLMLCLALAFLRKLDAPRPNLPARLFAPLVVLSVAALIETTSSAPLSPFGRAVGTIIAVIALAPIANVSLTSYSIARTNA